MTDLIAAAVLIAAIAALTIAVWVTADAIRGDDFDRHCDQALDLFTDPDLAECERIWAAR